MSQNAKITFNFLLDFKCHWDFLNAFSRHKADIQKLTISSKVFYVIQQSKNSPRELCRQPSNSS